MDRDELLTLDKEALVDLIVRLYERVTELEARVGRPPKGPGNSSIPPSAGYKSDRAERRRKKRGPKKGHQGLSRRRAAPDAVVRCRPTACRGCGAALAETGQRRVRRSQVIELPELRPVVIEAWVYAARCTTCGERTIGEAPAGLEASRTFGPRVEALLGYLHYGHHLSHERLVVVCESVFGLRISEGAIAAALARLAIRAEPEMAAIREAVRASPAINSDETGVRVDGRNWWHWVFQVPTASYHVIAPSRGADVVMGFLGDARPEVWGSDAFPTQFAAPASQHQLCLSHQIRDPVGIPRSGGAPWWAMTYAVEVDGPAGAGWARELRHVFGRALCLHRDQGRVTPATFANRRVRIERAADRLIFGFPLGVGEAWQLQKRYRRHRAKLFVCLYRDDVEPTNNSSERDLRNSVIHDKVTGGYRSRRGAEQGAVFATLLTTARKLGQNAYARLCSTAGPSPLLAAGMAT
jgi:transposase